ncbi:NINE protein [Cyanobacterium stanieri LEGE 03274]|uniref:NINE protein n=1 Tax=Cyanobacterium stanieri LEGE 03274 TaxID=1828756 RepID=A0ABR9V6E6_9CHRO|nr:NINE protein [Cyanobacterium stanieri]MBE9223478.1 NINE protein [Cyanobacterium stanieri LEGE 03274]
MSEFNASEVQSKKMAAGICGILLGSFGIHKFILGYNQEGIILLLVSLLTCGFGAAITGIIGIVEGVIYLMKTDEEFYNMYLNGKQPWF